MQQTAAWAHYQSVNDKRELPKHILLKCNVVVKEAASCESSCPNTTSPPLLDVLVRPQAVLVAASLQIYRTCDYGLLVHSDDLAVNGAEIFGLQMSPSNHYLSLKQRVGDGPSNHYLSLKHRVGGGPSSYYPSLK